MGGRPLRTLASTVRRLGLNDIAIDVGSRSCSSSRNFPAGRRCVPSRKVEEGNDAIGISQRGVALCPAHRTRTTTRTSTCGISPDHIRHNQEEYTPCPWAGIRHAYTVRLGTFGPVVGLALGVCGVETRCTEGGSIPRRCDSPLMQFRILEISLGATSTPRGQSIGSQAFSWTEVCSPILLISFSS